MTVGHYFDRASRQSKTLAERWDGRTWTVVASPSPSTAHCGTCAGEIENYLSAVSCPTRKFCVAVGAYVTAPGPNQQVGPLGTLAEVWDGHTWTVSPSPTPGTYDVLTGVSCTSRRSCVAVGSTEGPTQVETLIERWDGHTWTVDPSPNPGTFRNHLLAVSCASRSACMAVGESGNFPGPPLVERWDGHTWTALPSPDLPERCCGFAILDGVSCPTPNSCIAVGKFYDDVIFHTLSERWDGKTWTVLASPNPNTSRRSTNELFSVSCLSATSCVGVGDTQEGAGPGDSFPFVGTWNGHDWTIIPLRVDVMGISCATHRSCFAVGDAFSATGMSATRILSGTAPRSRRH